MTVTLLEQLTEAANSRPGERVIHVTNHASAMILHAQAAKDLSCSTRVISNSKDLSREVSTRKYDRWIGNPLARIEGTARAIASAPTVKIGDAQFGLANLAVVDKLTSTAESAQQSIFVFEDSIDSDGFGSLLSYYSTAEPKKMPTIVMAANRHVDQLKSKLLRYAENFSFHEVYGSTSIFWSSSNKTAPMGIADIVKGLLGNNTLAVANTDFSLDGVDATDFEEVSHKLSAAYAVIRSINFEYSKFASADLTRKALRLLDSTDISRLSDGQRKAFQAFRILFLLWDLYVHERYPERLDEAIKLSSEIGSDLLKAHCQRLINLNAGYSEFSRHCLEQAELVFRRFNQDPMAIYCKNNALLNTMHQQGRTTDQFKDLIDEATDKCPAMFSMVRLLNNAGVAALLDSRYEEALEFFQQSSKFNALPIHRLGLEANGLICRFIMGDNISADELDRLVIRTERAKITQGYGYHQAIILLNVMRMQQGLRHSPIQTHNLLSERQFMAYDDVLNNKISAARFLEKNLPTTAPQGKYKGQRGDFILRTDLVPVVHFGWS